MAQFGSGRSIIAQNQSAVSDSNGNLIVSPDDSFGASPLGVAARTQALYGIPNANFDILPADPYTAISSGNVLPYWDTVVSGEGTALMQYDTTTQSWAVQLDPTACATAGETITMRARTYLLNDSDLTLRQKAFASITKVGTQATSEWDLVLSATYYSEAGVQLSTYDIGTANSGTTWTTINGFTTSGTAAIDSAAHYADIALTLTTSGSVAGTALVNINSLLIQTSTGSGGAQSFLLTQTFTSSGDFVVPPGVDYVSVVGMAGGNGGNGGGLTCVSATSANGPGGAGGRGPYWLQREAIYVGGLGTISVGIGAGGSGGTATSFTKAAAGTTTLTATATTGGLGASTTFGSLLTIARGSADVSLPYGLTQLGQSTGGVGGTSIGAGTAPGGAGQPHPLLSFTSAPFTTLGTAGSAGGSATGTGGSAAVNGTGGAANGTAGIAAGGGGGGGSFAGSAAGLNAVQGGPGGIGAAGGGGSGGGGAGRYINGTVTITGTAGNGANGTYLSSGGGGGGGIAVARNTGANYTASTITIQSGAGGDGYPGWLTVYYVA
jgi:hypothetical protein